MNFEITVDAISFPYLIAQRGVLDRYKANPPIWVEKYQQMLESQFALIEPYLPPQPIDNVIDVGSGIGGIDVLIFRHYHGVPTMDLIDGADDKPIVGLHRNTFNSSQATRHFLKENGVNRARYFDADQVARGIIQPTRTADLVISTAAWCFHFDPAVYLDYIAACCKPGATIILDVRIDKDDWLEQLRRRFTNAERILRSFKFETYVFRAPAALPEAA